MLTIPEIACLDSYSASVRIPPELNVPLTERVRRIIDTKAFRRLASIRQVGLVSLVYPAARHTRFEHSLGVFRLALLFLKRLAAVPRFAETVSKHNAEVFIVTALLHDIGHWAFCHPLEDIRIEELPHHEEQAAVFLNEPELANVLRNGWNIEPEEIVQLLNHEGQIPPANTLLHSILSGPIDIDKMDYLERDSLHCGVPYGRNFDPQRLIGSLCLNEVGDGLAITEKGKTAAELMIFARYVMFSEVYWHHTVRAATSMLQRLVWELHQAGKIDFERLLHCTEDEAIRCFRQAAKNEPCEVLAEGLFGERRVLYKQVAQFSILDQNEIYRKLAGKPYRQLCGLAAELARLCGINSAANTILIDAPPVEKEVEIKIDVYEPKTHRYRKLEDISPVVRAMAKEQFDDYVKRVRVFAHPAVAACANQSLTTYIHELETPAH
ncbi:MAG: HD domain-containing protein [Planctomycetaceae bacterium]|jgi:HD superfamily phosphohydrolase|nr:HD domain-containing protein [Planctomycetaceae bacterium]